MRTRDVLITQNAAFLNCCTSILDGSGGRMLDNGGLRQYLQLVETGEDVVPPCWIFSGLDGQREISIERDDVVP